MIRIKLLYKLDTMFSVLCVKSLKRGFIDAYRVPKRKSDELSENGFCYMTINKNYIY